VGEPSVETEAAKKQRAQETSEFHANRQVVHRLKSLVGELQQQAALAAAWKKPRQRKGKKREIFFR
jgi:hypothetical protein